MNEINLYFLIIIATALVAITVVPSAVFQRVVNKFGGFCEVLFGIVFLYSLLAGILREGWGNNFSVQWGWVGVHWDRLSWILALLVSFLGTVIVRYARNYLAGDKRQGYFFKWLSVTVGSVLVLVLAPGLWQFAFAWVGMSIGLHQLLIYFPNRRGTLLSARKKFVFSRLGDVLLLVSFYEIFSTVGASDWASIFSWVRAGGEISAWVVWALIFTALLKSVQFPFHTWLPDTMGTPTPVSALMHAGLVNAGGFLIVRFSPLLVEVPSALTALAWIGAFTAGFAAMVMLTQTSVKRSLAYSTIAQMGFMMLQCGLGAFSLAILHLVAHSLYKGYAFLSSGSAVNLALRARLDIHGRPVSRHKIWIAVGSALLIVGTVFVMPGLANWGKAGTLVLSVFVVMALTQLIWVQMKRGLSLLPTVAMSIALTLGYFLLADLFSWFLADITAVNAVRSWMLEAMLALALFIFLVTSIRFQDGEPGFLTVEYKRRLYVHALNGFYMNTLINRLARKMGLVPAGR